MKFSTAVALLLTLTVGLVAGHKIGYNHKAQSSAREIRLLRSDLERFTNKAVFNHAVYVSKLTGRPLYQVLTGKTN